MSTDAIVIEIVTIEVGERRVSPAPQVDFNVLWMGGRFVFSTTPVGQLKTSQVVKVCVCQSSDEAHILED